MAKKSKKIDDNVCSVAGCNQPHHARGLCQKHYDEYRKKNRKKSPDTSNQRKVCSVQGCKRTHHARGYCKMHYAKLVKAKQAAVRDVVRPDTEAANVELPSPENDQDAFMGKRLALIKQRHRLLLKQRKLKKK